MRRAGDLGRNLDRRVGDAVARAVCAHHERRLARLGKHPLDAPAGGLGAGCAAAARRATGSRC